VPHTYQSTERSSNKHRQLNGEAYSHLYENICKVCHEDKPDITGKMLLQNYEFFQSNNIIFAEKLINVVSFEAEL
jgi:hypothetical protein